MDDQNENNDEFSEKKPAKNKSMAGFIVVIIIVVVLGIIAAVLLFNSSLNSMNKSNDTGITSNTTPVPAVEKKAVAKSEYYLENNNFSKFDMSFLKFENQKKNMIYSPLSIKYAFRMLYDGTSGEARDQLASIVDGYNLTKYNSNDNMALGNAFFIRNSYKDSIKENYTTLLQKNYNADVITDSFESSNIINDWVKGKTLGLIEKLVTDDDIQDADFVLVNALGIDMEWKNKFAVDNYSEFAEMRQRDNNIVQDVGYQNERFNWNVDPMLINKMTFDNGQEVSAVNAVASINNYDIVKDLGEDQIRKTVYDAFVDWARSDEGEFSNWFNGDYSEENIKDVFERWFTGSFGYVDIDSEGVANESDGTNYIEALKSNYGQLQYNTDFKFFEDTNVKVFSKELKEYDGTILEYIGIMPKEKDLNSYIENTSYDKILKLANSAKELKNENFEDGYITFIHGTIPKFTFDYELNLMDDLKKLGITNIFEQGKANLTELTSDEGAFIQQVKHMANIEFSQFGIKASAATAIGGLGGGESGFSYSFKVPVIDVDLTFDKPYMFLIRDKKTGETWFVGAVYNPLNVDDDETKENIADYSFYWNYNWD